MSGTPWSLTTQSDRFKIKYGKLADKVYNAGNPITMQIKTTNDFVGKSMIEDNPLGFSGSVGSRVIPKSNVGNYANSTLTSKKLYATVIVDRESMKASSTTEGAFFKFMDKPVKDAMESFDRNRSRQFFNDGSGVLGKGAPGVTKVSGNGSTATPYLVYFQTSFFHESNFEEKDYVQVVTGITSNVTNTGGTAEGADTETNLLEVTEVNAALNRISLVGTSTRLALLAAGAANYTTGTASQSGVTITGIGTTFIAGMVGGEIKYADGTFSGVITVFNSATSLTVEASGSKTVGAQAYSLGFALGSSDAIAMQRSYGGDFTGLRLGSQLSVAFDAGTAGLTLYGIPLQRRWKMTCVDASAAAITVAKINSIAIAVEKKCGKAITMIASSYDQYTKMLDLQEGLKQYTIVAPANSAFSKATFGFKAVEYQTTTGPVPIIPDRMIHSTEIWLLNKNYIEYRLRPDGAKWADEDGTVFLRTGSDSYEATYACYGDLQYSPGYHGHLYNLSL
jgi:hypothetical protein